MLSGDGVEVIYDGPRAYYDGRLYPLFCRFELVLRRLLLAAARVNPSAKGASALKDAVLAGDVHFYFRAA